MCETNLIVLLNKIIYVSICILFSFRIESDVVKCTLRFVWYQYVHACVCRIIWLSNEWVVCGFWLVKRGLNTWAHAWLCRVYSEVLWGYRMLTWLGNGFGNFMLLVVV